MTNRSIRNGIAIAAAIAAALTVTACSADDTTVAAETPMSDTTVEVSTSPTIAATEPTETDGAAVDCPAPVPAPDLDGPTVVDSELAFRMSDSGLPEGYNWDQIGMTPADVAETVTGLLNEAMPELIWDATTNAHANLNAVEGWGMDLNVEARTAPDHNPMGMGAVAYVTEVADGCVATATVTLYPGYYDRDLDDSLERIQFDFPDLADTAAAWAGSFTFEATA